MNIKTKLQIATALAVACSAGLGLLAADRKAPPSKDFVDGFTAGVRYGLIARMQNPKQDDIPTLTEVAKKLYWVIVVDEGKTLIEAATCTNAPTKKP